MKECHGLVGYCNADSLIISIRLYMQDCSDNAAVTYIVY